MPYAQVHQPLENKEWFKHHFRADFIAELADPRRLRRAQDEDTFEMAQCAEDDSG